MAKGLAVFDAEAIAEAVVRKYSRPGFLAADQVREVAMWVLNELAGMPDELIIDAVRRRRERD